MSKNKISTPAQKQKEELLAGMTALSKDFKCHGSMGELALTNKEDQEIPLSQLARIGVMSSDYELVRNALALGADPHHKIKGQSLIQLAKAFHQRKILDKRILKVITQYAQPEVADSVKPEPAARHTRHKKPPARQ